MTFNGSCGYMPYAPDEDWHSTRKVISMLQQVTSGRGNLLLNIGPQPDGSVPQQAVDRLIPVGKWLKKNEEAVYGEKDNIQGCFDFCPLGSWTRKGRTAYFWCTRWPGKKITIGGFRRKLKKASFLTNGKIIRFKQNKQQLTLMGLPKNNPDKIAQRSVIKLEFVSKPVQKLGAGCVII